jgi:hypothetical protein
MFIKYVESGTFFKFKDIAGGKHGLLILQTSRWSWWLSASMGQLHAASKDCEVYIEPRLFIIRGFKREFKKK